MLGLDDRKLKSAHGWESAVQAHLELGVLAFFVVLQVNKLWILWSKKTLGTDDGVPGEDVRPAVVDSYNNVMDIFPYRI